MTAIAALGRTLWAPFCATGSWYNRTAQAHPFATGIVTSGLKTSAADAFAQKFVERHERMDWTRHAVFCTFGFAYLGAFQYYLYNVKFTQWCGPLTRRFGHKASAPVKTFIDQALHHPFVYFPVFYSMKAVVSGKPQPFAYAADKYRTEIWDSCRALWAVWVPAQLVNFAFVPRHLRVPYVAAVSFGWTMILSVMQGRFDSAREAQAQQGEQARQGLKGGAPYAAYAAPAGGGAALPLPLLAGMGRAGAPVVATSVVEGGQDRRAGGGGGAPR